MKNMELKWNALILQVFKQRNFKTFDKLSRKGNKFLIFLLIFGESFRPALSFSLG